MADALTDKDKVRKAYGSATTLLREKHREEFNTLMAAAALELGVEWSPRPTADQKAEKALLDLLAANPSLAAKYTGNV